MPWWDMQENCMPAPLPDKLFPN